MLVLILLYYLQVRVYVGGPVGATEGVMGRQGVGTDGGGGPRGRSRTTSWIS